MADIYVFIKVFVRLWIFWELNVLIWTQLFQNYVLQLILIRSRNSEAVI